MGGRATAKCRDLSHVKEANSLVFQKETPRATCKFSLLKFFRQREGTGLHDYGILLTVSPLQKPIASKCNLMILVHSHLSYCSHSDAAATKRAKGEQLLRCCHWRQRLVSNYDQGVVCLGIRCVQELGNPTLSIWQVIIKLMRHHWLAGLEN